MREMLGGAQIDMEAATRRRSGLDVRTASRSERDVVAKPSAAETTANMDRRSAPAAQLKLPSDLDRQSRRYETGPILGWYSVELAERVPDITMLGQGRCAPGTPLFLPLIFVRSKRLLGSADYPQSVSLLGSDSGSPGAPEIEAEAK